MGSVQVPETQKLLHDALGEAVANFTRKHAASKKSHDEACLYMPGGNTRTTLSTSPFPFTIASARSCYITTIDGYDYVDFLGEFTAGIYGHNHPAIRQAIEKALEGGWNFGAHSKVEQELAKAICTRFPAMEMVRFVNSGTEANMIALATALAASPVNAKKILIFEKSYHGSTVTGRVPNGKPTINLPHDFIIGQYNDIPGTKALIASLPPHTLAAILVEPMLGSGGCYVASYEFLKLLRDMATQHRAMLIFDEVMTSRLSYNGLGETFGIKPDLMTIGKYLGGGMTFGGFGGRGDIMALYDPRKGQLEHPGTFNNNVFTMHAGVAGARLLTSERLAALNQLGNEMKGKVEAVLEKHGIMQLGTVPMTPVVDEMLHESSYPLRPPKLFIKGVGSIMCIHFAGPDRDLLQGLFYHHMLEQGIFMAQRGFIALSLEITEEHVEQFVMAVDSFCRQWHAALQWQFRLSDSFRAASN